MLHASRPLGSELLIRSKSCSHALSTPVQYAVTMSARTDVEAEANQNTSGVTPDTLQSTLKEKLEAQHVEIADLSGNPAVHDFPTVRLSLTRHIHVCQVAAAKCLKPSS